MTSFMAFIQLLTANWQNILAGVNGLVAALILIFLAIPGTQPEKFLHSVADFLSKFSVKPPAPPTT
jgi:hypothetical protein